MHRHGCPILPRRDHVVVVARVALARRRQPRGRLAEEPRDRDVGGTGSDLQEAPHHLGQPAEVDRLARPGLAVAEQQQVVDRLHRRRIGEAGGELRGGLGRGQMLAEVRHRHDVDLGLVHERGGARGRQRRGVHGVVEGLQHRIRPGTGGRPGVGQGVAEESGDPRGLEPQRRAAGGGEVVEGRLAAPGAQRVTGQTRGAELPARHDMQELEPAGPDPRLVERAGQGGGVGLARAEHDGAAAIEPAQHQGALHRLAQPEPALRGLGPRHVGGMARPGPPFAHHVVGHDVDDLPGEPVAPVHRIDLGAGQVEDEEGVAGRLVLAGAERGREVRQAVARLRAERERHGGAR